MKGRPPKTKQQLKIAGSQLANGREEIGRLRSSVPEPPEWLNERGKEVFRWLAEREIEMASLAESDYPLLARYAVVFVLWENAAKMLQGTPLAHVEVLNKDGTLKFTRASAAATQAKECLEQLRHMDVVLGLSPTDRARMGVGAKAPDNDPGEAFFAGLDAETA